MMPKAAPTSVVASANDGTRRVSVLTSATYWLSGALALVATIAGAIRLIPSTFITAASTHLRQKVAVRHNMDACYTFHPVGKGVLDRYRNTRCTCHCRIGRCIRSSTGRPSSLAVVSSLAPRKSPAQRGRWCPLHRRLRLSTPSRPQRRALGGSRRGCDAQEVRRPRRRGPPRSADIVARRSASGSGTSRRSRVIHSCSLSLRQRLAVRIE